MYATAAILGLISLYQFYTLFRFIEQSNRTLQRFLQSIKYSDFTQSFTAPAKGSGFGDLSAAFNAVIADFQAARREKEEHFRYLQTVVQHIGIGLIAFRSDGEVELINTAAKRLLKVNSLRNIGQLKEIDAEFARTIMGVQPGKRIQAKLHHGGETFQLTINTAVFVLHQQNYVLISLQNIQQELEEKEMEAWQTLIRTLTHEIMNSITPISSLSSTANQLLLKAKQTDEKCLQEETFQDISNALGTIEKRSKGLLNFVENYRKLTRIPKPNFEILPVKELFNRTTGLMKEFLLAKSIKCQVSIDPENLEITGDPALLEQVMINLCKNAVEAAAEVSSPEISLRAFIAEGNTIIQVTDNGCGIPPEAAENIFVPFFTTKKDGSGIGLSLSRQIMRLHGGTIMVKCEAGQTVFSLRF